MLRRIATKWVLTVLAAVLVPFLGFAWYIDGTMAERHWATVRYYLLTMAGETAARVDDEVRERLADVETMARTNPVTSWAIADWDGQEAGFRTTVENGFNRFVEQGEGWDLILGVNAQGELVVQLCAGELVQLPPAVPGQTIALGPLPQRLPVFGGPECLDKTIRRRVGGVARAGHVEPAQQRFGHFHTTLRVRLIHDMDDCAETGEMHLDLSQAKPHTQGARIAGQLPAMRDTRGVKKSRNGDLSCNR